MIVLPIDTKSLFFNIKNDNDKGHTSTVATPLKKKINNFKLSDILKIKNHEVKLKDKFDLLELLIKHSKSKILIKNIYSFKNLSVNGIKLKTEFCFGCYIKQEIDETKVQYNRLKLHYPSKFIYCDDDLNINNKKIYQEISKLLNDYAFIITSFEYFEDEERLNFRALIVGENGIKYSKVFINEKGCGNKFNKFYNINYLDYEKEKNLFNQNKNIKFNSFSEFVNEIRSLSFKILIKKIKNIEIISLDYPYSLFDFIYLKNNVLQYGILRATSSNKVYFDLFYNQQNFIRNYKDKTKIFLITNILTNPILKIINFTELNKMETSIKLLTFEEKYE